MPVRIVSARSDEHGNATGGKAGDQTGKEISQQDWYAHNKGWVCLRAKDPAKAKLIAECARAADANRNIGYDQNQNTTLWNAAKPFNFDCAKVTTPCETDCARLVRVCCAYAGILAADFYTATEVSALMATGEFNKSTSAKYCKSPDYLQVGDILVTKTKGHTVIVLTNGPLANVDDGGTAGDGQNPYAMPKRGSVQKKGAKGENVYWIQFELRDSGYDIAIDGDFGTKTLEAVKAFQKRYGLLVDGHVGNDTRDMLVAKTNASTEPEPPTETPPVVSGTTVGKIIDISYCDHTIDWAKLAAQTGANKIIFVIIRAQGKSLDDKLKRNIAGCEKYGIPYGVYSYSYSFTDSAAAAEATSFYNRVKAAGGNPAAWYLDAEEGKNTTSGAKAFFKQLKTLVGDVYVGFYSYDSRCVNWKSTVDKFDGCWSARWNGLTSKLAPNYKGYHLWQYGMTKVAGVDVKVDTNRLAPGLTLEAMLKTK